jgi:hypothetical protein
MPIDVITTGDPQWEFIDPSFVGQFQTQFSANWNIVNLESGIYEVKTTSYYNPVSLPLDQSEYLQWNHCSSSRGEWIAQNK